MGATVTSSVNPAVAPAASRSVFIGRQPILTRERQLFGYELLYRSNDIENHYNGQDG